MSDYPTLDRVSHPRDLDDLSATELRGLCQEIRDFLYASVQQTGGHLSATFGVVELTVALHRVFDFPDDTLIWDVGHQVYAHKLLTGRRERFPTLRQLGGLSGFSYKPESPFDAFTTGHGGPSISTGLGCAIAHALNNDGRRTVAVIGDGALGEGVALEAINHAGSLPNNLLVVLNDNSMSIGRTMGALAKYTSKFRSARRYRSFQTELKSFLENIPLIGKQLQDAHAQVRHILRSIAIPKWLPGALFQELGYHYHGPIDGHDLESLLESLEQAKQLNEPVLLHCITNKGQGIESDEREQPHFHGIKPPKHLSGGREYALQSSTPYTNHFIEHLTRLAKADERICAVSAAMLDGTGLREFQAEFPDRCWDVGMAEQHAVAMAAGLATGGLKPVVCIYSTFLQRAFDQLVHDVAIQNLPVVFAVDRGGLVGPDGVTHNGVFDIAYCRLIPGTTLMAPRDGGELGAMLELALELPGPSFLRYPRCGAPETAAELPHQDFGVGEAEVLRTGPDGALIAYGAMVYPALEIAERVAAAEGLELTVVNARFAKPLDEATLAPIVANAPRTFTLEDHSEVGGFGSAVLEMCNRLGVDARTLEIVAYRDEFLEHGARPLVMRQAGVQIEPILTRILGSLTATGSSRRVS